jgi:hypothetical protein
MLYAAGAVLLASGSLHVLIWLTEGGSLAGPVSWRKPILFGLSAGATLLSLGWVLGTIRRRAGDTFFMGTFALAMLVEVGLITLQQWRGVASHFNRASALDTSILNIIEALILLVTVAIADLTWRSFQQLRASVDVALAVRSGMLLLLLSCILGFVMVAWGNHQMALGLPPETFGTAGVMKFPHGVPMHAIQALPIFTWLLWKLGVPESQRTTAVAYMIGSMVAFTAYSLLQTFTGRARFEAWWLSTVVLIASAALLMVPLWTGVTWTIRLCRSSAAR